MNNVIITGGDGFVGSNTVHCFLEHGIKVLAIDRNVVPCRLVKHDKLKYQSVDITDTEKLKHIIPSGEYDTFIHFAWAGSAGPERMDYNMQMQNALMTVECMKVAKRIGCLRFVCAGSIMEKEAAAAVAEQGNKPGMAYIYGMGKLIAHNLCKVIAANIGIDLIWPMITNAYGIGEYSPRFVNTTIRKIINKDPLQFTVATQNYDFVYVTDVAEAFFSIAKNGKPFCEYIIGSSNARPLKEFIIEMINELMPGVVPLFGQIPFTGTNLPLAAFDTTATENDTGFRASISFAKGTKMTMNWIKAIQEKVI